MAFRKVPTDLVQPAGWQEYTTDFALTNLGAGSVALKKAFYRLSPDKSTMSIRAYFKKDATAGTGAALGVAWSMPPGWQIDTTTLNTNVVRFNLAGQAMSFDSPYAQLAMFVCMQSNDPNNLYILQRSSNQVVTGGETRANTNWLIHAFDIPVLPV